jgi:hypothetical protein
MYPGSLWWAGDEYRKSAVIIEQKRYLLGEEIDGKGKICKG